MSKDKRDVGQHGQDEEVSKKLSKLQKKKNKSQSVENSILDEIETNITILDRKINRAIKNVRKVKQ